MKALLRVESGTLHCNPPEAFLQFSGVVIRAAAPAELLPSKFTGSLAMLTTVAIVEEEFAESVADVS